MVSSGLAERTSVSHIRLAIHLMFAFITFAFTFYYGLELIYSEKKETVPNKKLSALNKLVFVVLSIQIIYGAFVAGLHAGKIHNTFPLMSGQVIPTGMNAMQPTWLNIFDNPVTVQFIHRFLAFTLLFLVAWFYVESGKEKLNNFQKKGIHILIAAIGIQFLLGVITVLTQANIVMASVHQIGAFFLFSASIYLLFHFRKAA